MQHLCHAAVGVAQFQFPVNETLVNLYPVFGSLAIGNLSGNVEEVLLVTTLSDFGHDFLAVDILFQGEEYLAGIDGLDQVVGNL